MKILLCSIPDGSLEETLKPFNEKSSGYKPIRPIGILRLIDWMKKKGFEGEAYDINNMRPSDQELIKTFKRIKPTVVGLSATLTHCYPNVKRITTILRQLFPNVWIVVGGHIVASSNVILSKTETDICVIGDGEIPWAKLLEYFKLHPVRQRFDYEYLNQIKGLAFLDRNNKLKVTGNAEQVPAEELEYPDYDTLKAAFQEKGELVYNLFVPIKDHNIVKHTKFYDKNKNKFIAYVESAKGCVARCTFCQRYTKGYRPYVLTNLEAHILNLKEKYNVAGIDITDENFGSNKKQSYELARIMKKCDVFWIVGAARCTSVTYEDLKFYKEHNLIYMKFGIESGSQKILDVMEKKFYTNHVYTAVANCKKNGVLTEPDAIMAGMPGETRKTIEESAKFMCSLRYVLDKDWCIDPPAFWAMAIPGTPLYEYCQQIKLIGKTIDEEEEYLMRLSEQKANVLNYLNITESNNREVHYWNYLFVYDAKKEYINLIFRDHKSIRQRILKIYQKCIKPEFIKLTSLLKLMNDRGYNVQTRTSIRNNKIKFYIWGSGYFLINMFLSLLTVFLPRAALHSILKIYARYRYNVLERKYKVKKGKQKYNFFLERKHLSDKKFMLTEERMARTTRQIDRSLRSITMANRKLMKPDITDEEKGLAILAKGQ